MKKTIIAVYGSAQEGKSSTIKKVCQKLIANFPDAIASDLAIDYSADISVTIIIGNIKIGIESQGDPSTGLLERLDKLAIDGCDIIICATRRRGETTNAVGEVAEKYNYNMIWLSSYFSQKDSPKPLNSLLLNDIAAKSIIEIIEGLKDNKF